MKSRDTFHTCPVFYARCPATAGGAKLYAHQVFPPGRFGTQTWITTKSAFASALPTFLIAWGSSAA
jgi:hypothetical protein